MSDSDSSSNPSKRDGAMLDASHYHAVLFGTGLTNTIVAGALSKSDHSVLHVDIASEYGSHLSTLNLSSFKAFLEAHSQSHQQSLQSESKPVEAKLLQEWREIAGDAACKFEYEPLIHRSPFFNGSFVDYTEQAAAAAAAESSAAPPADAPTVSVSEEQAGENATPAPVPTPAPKPAQPTVSPLMSQSRRFSIDVTPHLIFSRSPIIDLLVASGIHNYLEFKAVDHAYFGNQHSTAASSATSAGSPPPPALTLLPLGKSAVFQSNALGMLEKRLLMKFMHLILGDDYHLSSDETAKQSAILLSAGSEQSFGQFLKAQKLTANLTQMVMYAVTLLDETPQAAEALPTSVGVARLRAYLSSCGRYGPGAFLYPNYGISELPQSFARLCAVNKGIFMLRITPEAIVYETADDASKQYKGIIMPSGQFITSDALVSEVEYIDSTRAQEVDCPIVSRMVLFLDAALPSSIAGTPLSGSSVFSISPPSQSEAPIYGLQLGVEVNAAPQGRFVIYLWCVSPNVAHSVAAMARLNAYASAWTKAVRDETSEATKPTLLGKGSYQQKLPAQVPTPTVAPALPETQPQEIEDKTVAPAASSAEKAAEHADENESGLPPHTFTSEPLVKGVRLVSSTRPTLAHGLDLSLTDATNIVASLGFPAAKPIAVSDATSSSSAAPSPSTAAIVTDASLLQRVMRATREEERPDEEMEILQQLDSVQPNQEQAKEEDSEQSSAPDQNETVQSTAVSEEAAAPTANSESAQGVSAPESS